MREPLAPHLFTCYNAHELECLFHPVWMTS
jgi:hypothetical protein